MRTKLIRITASALVVAGIFIAGGALLPARSTKADPNISTSSSTSCPAGTELHMDLTSGGSCVPDPSTDSSDPTAATTTATTTPDTTSTTPNVTPVISKTSCP